MEERTRRGLIPAYADCAFSNGGNFVNAQLFTVRTLAADSPTGVGAFQIFPEQDGVTLTDHHVASYAGIDEPDGSRPTYSGYRISAMVIGTISSGVQVDHRFRLQPCLLYTSPSPRDRQKSRMPSSA